MPAYDSGMIIESLAKLCEWAAAAGTAPEAVEYVAGVIWRHAHGQGLAAGDDWGWILEQYGPDQIREIEAAAASAAKADRSRRNRRGF